MVLDWAGLTAEGTCLVHLDGVLVPWVVPGGLGLRGMRGLCFLLLIKKYACVP